MSGFANVEVKTNEWDYSIEELTSDLQNNKTLLIIDSLDNADLFHPKQKRYDDKSVTPADSLKTLLEQCPRLSSFVLAFVDNWKRFNNVCKDYADKFEMRIGFLLNEEDAGNLIAGGFERFKGLDKANKAVFVNRQRNVQTMFRPFVVRLSENVRLSLRKKDE